MNIPYDTCQIFLLVLNLLTLTIDKFLEKMALVITLKEIKIKASTMQMVTKSFYWYQNICSCDFRHLWNWPISDIGGI